MKQTPLLQVKNLQIQLQTDNGIIQPVDQVDLTIQAGEIFALVGESGCGKSLTALAISRLLPENAYICQGSEIILAGKSLQYLSENQMRQHRGQKIAMIFQDAATALNPILTIGEQIKETIAVHDPAQATQSRIFELLKKVQLPEPATLARKYPHQLSGGMKQRVMIAIALAQSPDLLIADEPTTALDVTTQAQILNLLKDLNEQEQMAVLLITHDLGVVAQMADNIAVMYAGHVVEQATKKEFLTAPKHPYSQQLFAALPDNVKPNQMLAAIPGRVPTLDKNFPLCRFKDRCAFVFGACEAVKPKLTPISATNRVRCHWYDPEILKQIPTTLKIQNLSSLILNREIPLTKELRQEQAEEQPLLTVKDLKVHYPIHAGLFKRTVGHVKAVDGVSFDIYEGETLALVGESGCGKTSVGKAILRLIKDHQGRVEFQGQDLISLSSRQLRKKRSDIQMIFQDPFSSMDPHMEIGEILEEGMKALKIGTDENERQERIDILLEQVGLPLQMRHRYPHELSGGQKQRVAIARALAVGAQLIVCDEPTSALDVSVQAQILNLLKSLQNDLGISYLFITHNIGVVKYLADYVAIMYLGRIIEYGSMQAVLQSPKHPYTQALLQSVPSISEQPNHHFELAGNMPDPSHPPQGCHFAPRCPHVHERCLKQYPPSYQVEKEHEVKCYLHSPEERGEVGKEEESMAVSPFKDMKSSNSWTAP